LQIGRPAQQCTGRSLVKVGGTYVARAIRQYRTKPLKLGEGVETGWRAPLVGVRTIRLSSKGESDRITQGVGGALTLSRSDADLPILRIASRAGQRDWPHLVNRYSTFGGTSGYAVRCTMPQPPCFLITAPTWLISIGQSLGSIGLMSGFLRRIAAGRLFIILTGALIVHLPDGWTLNWFGSKKGEGIEYLVWLRGSTDLI
jgi:uncharacterized membrane protein YphA (DoxX/SURF4 family)